MNILLIAANGGTVARGITSRGVALRRAVLLRRCEALLGRLSILLGRLSILLGRLSILLLLGCACRSRAAATAASDIHLLGAVVGV